VPVLSLSLSPQFEKTSASWPKVAANCGCWFGRGTPFIEKTVHRDQIIE